MSSFCLEGDWAEAGHTFCAHSARDLNEFGNRMSESVEESASGVRSSGETIQISR